MRRTRDLLPCKGLSGCRRGVLDGLSLCLHCCSRRGTLGHCARLPRGGGGGGLLGRDIRVGCGGCGGGGSGLLDRDGLLLGQGRGLGRGLKIHPLGCGGGLTRVWLWRVTCRLELEA